MKIVLTGNYDNCKDGNIVSISKDNGKNAGYDGLVLSKLKPKKDFLQNWNNIENLIDQKEYIKDYYVDVLSKLDPRELIDSLPDYTIIVDYDTSMYRHLVAFWLELFLEIKSYEIEVNSKRDTLQRINRPEYLKSILKKVIEENYDMGDYTNISAAYLYNKSKEIENTYKLSLKNN